MKSGLFWLTLAIHEKMDTPFFAWYYRCQGNVLRILLLFLMVPRFCCSQKHLISFSSRQLIAKLYCTSCNEWIAGNQWLTTQTTTKLSFALTFDLCLCATSVDRAIFQILSSVQNALPPALHSTVDTFPEVFCRLCRIIKQQVTCAIIPS